MKDTGAWPRIHHHVTRRLRADCAGTLFREIASTRLSSEVARMLLDEYLPQGTTEAPHEAGESENAQGHRQERPQGNERAWSSSRGQLGERSGLFDGHLVRGQGARQARDIEASWYRRARRRACEASQEESPHVRTETPSQEDIVGRGSQRIVGGVNSRAEDGTRIDCSLIDQAMLGKTPLEATTPLPTMGAVHEWRDPAAEAMIGARDGQQGRGWIG